MKPQTVEEILKKVASFKKIKPSEILARSEQPAVVRARLLAAYFLSSKWGGDKARVMLRLNCSSQHVDLANEMSTKNVEFRQEIAQIESPAAAPSIVPEAKTSPPAPVEQPSDVDAKAFLFRIAWERYQVSPEILFEKKISTKIASVRRMLAFVGGRTFSLSVQELAGILRADPDTIKRNLQNCEDDFVPPHPFHKEALAVAKQFGLSLERRKKLLAS